MPEQTEGMAGPSRFFALVGTILLVGGMFGWFALRKDLLGLSIGVLILCGPVMVVAVLVGIAQTRREARENNKPD